MDSTKASSVHNEKFCVLARGRHSVVRVLGLIEAPSLSEARDVLRKTLEEFKSPDEHLHTQHVPDLCMLKEKIFWVTWLDAMDDEGTKQAVESYLRQD